MNEEIKDVILSTLLAMAYDEQLCESLWNSSKFYQNPDNSPIFDPASPMENVDKISTATP